MYAPPGYACDPVPVLRALNFERSDDYILVGDCNAQSALWWTPGVNGCGPKSAVREKAAEFLESTVEEGWLVLINGAAPTTPKGSVLDLAFVSPSLAGGEIDENSAQNGHRVLSQSES